MGPREDYRVRPGRVIRTRERFDGRRRYGALMLASHVAHRRVDSAHRGPRTRWGGVRCKLISVVGVSSRELAQRHRNLHRVVGEGDGEEAWLSPALEALVRGDRESLSTFLHTVGSPIGLEATRASCRTHWVVLDANGRPKVKALALRLADEVIHYCVPRSKIEDALAHRDETGSLSKLMRLQREAQELFSRLDNSGEGGELLLYFLMELELGIPQILCKMSLKTNSQMHIHGVDGVHAELLEDERLAVYWGESKVYDSFSTALSACFNSIELYLNDDGAGPLQRDIHLVRDNIDAGNRGVTLALARYFDNDNPESNQLEVRGACLIGFSQSEYRSPFEADSVKVKAAVTELMTDWQSKIGQRIKDKNIAHFHIEVFCVPVPSAQDFRDAMKEALRLQ